MAHVDLSPRYERFIREQLESGRYSSASEVVEEALRLMEEASSSDEDPPGLDVEWMRQKIQESLDDPRPCVPAEEVFARLRRKIAAAKADAE